MKNHFSVSCLTDEHIDACLRAKLDLEQDSPSAELYAYMQHKYPNLVPKDAKQVRFAELEDFHFTFYLSCSVIEDKCAEQKNYLFGHSSEKMGPWEGVFTETKNVISSWLPLSEPQGFSLKLDIIFESELFFPCGGKADLRAMLQSSLEPGVYSYFLD